MTHDIRQSPNYAKYMRSLEWIVEKVGRCNIFVRHFPIPFFSRWSVIKIQRPQGPIPFAEIDKIAKKHHAILVKLEPIPPISLKSHGFRADSWPLLPTKTLVLDLDSTCLDSLPKDTRYEIRKAVSGGLHPFQGATLSAAELFYKLLQETMKIGHWSVPIRKEVIALWQAFRPNNSQILFAYVPQPVCRQAGLPKSPQSSPIPVAGCLLIWDKSVAHYMYAANTKVGRELGAAYFVLWKAIKFCQKKKLRYLDLEGVYDGRYAKNTRHWKGFTKFKMGWGGKVVDYPGSFSKIQLF